MNKKEIRAKINELLTNGTPKSEVFSQLSGQGVKDSQLAYFIASYPNRTLCEEHKGKVNFAIGIMALQALLGFFIGLGIGVKVGPNAQWIFAFAIAAIPLAIAWGFHENKAAAYNAYIVLTITQLPRSLQVLASPTTAAIVAVTINFAMLAYIWYVRSELFPDFSFIGVKKKNGNYIFTEQTQ